MWDRVVGQERAVGLLQRAAERPVHAYLLVGPRGSGLEDAARCFAAEVVAPDGRADVVGVALWLKRNHGLDTASRAMAYVGLALVPVAALAPAVTALTPPLGLVLRTPVRALADAAIDRFPEGPSEEQRRRSRFTVVALALGEGGTTGRGVVRGGDVYSLTATCAVQAASLLADEGYDRTGVLSPASAFDPPAFLDFLGDHGLSYELDRVAEGAAV